MIELNFRLKIITEPLSHRRKAEKLASIIQNDLGLAFELISIEPYHKITNSYKVEFILRFKPLNNQELVYQAILSTSKLAGPWLLYLNQSAEKFELLYNKSESTQSLRNEYQMIQWGHFFVI